jgi:hypothetical protein
MTTWTSACVVLGRPQRPSPRAGPARHRRVFALRQVKPEALTVLQESARGYQLLVSDGLCDGGALVFTVAR